MKEHTTIWASYGSTQEERLPQSLEDDYVLPFEKTLAQEIASLARLARSTKWANRGSSHWQALFRREPAIAIAELISFIDAVSTSHDLEHAQSMELHIRQRLEQLRLSETEGIWGLAGLVSGAAEFAEQRRIAHDADGSGSLSIANALSQHKLQLEEQLDLRLRSGDVDPALGLLLTTLNELRNIKARLNRFPDELLTYYYEQVLGLFPREGAPTALSLLASANLQPVDIPDGAMLTGGLTDDTKVAARTIGATRVVAASVQKLYQLRYWRDRALSPVNVLSWISSVGAEQIDESGMQLFSASKTAPFGLLIESQILALSGGRREIEIRFDMSHQQKIHPSNGHGEANCSEVIEAFSQDPELQFAFADAELAEDEGGKSATGIARAEQLSRIFAHWVYKLQTNEEFASSSGKSILEEWSATDIVTAALLLHVKTRLQFRTIARRIVIYVLLSGTRQWPAEKFLELLRGAAQCAKMPDPVQIVGNYAPEDLFFLLLGDAFTVQISSANGFFTPAAMYVTANPGDTPGVKFTLQLDATAPAVEAMEGFNSPCIQLILSPHARFSPVSLFEDVRIDAVDLSVSVKGLTQVSAFNDDGPLAVSQTIMPFGSQPIDGSEFLVGAPEIGNKSLEHVGVSYVLADLPPLPDNGKLDAYYANYGKEFYPPDPKLETAVLTADGWVTVSVDEPLISGAEKLSATKRHKVIQGNIANPAAPPPEKLTAIDFAERQSIRAGLVRLRLETSGRHFGVNSYPLALAESLRRSQRPLTRPKVPNPPLSIKFSSVSVDYRARRHISMRAPSPENSKDRIVQLGAFGRRQLYPATTTAKTTVFPQRLGDGTLYIGIGPDIPTGPVSLLFDFDDGGRECLPVVASQIAWRVLTDDGWQKLGASSIYSDTTVGLQRTGVVTLQLPEATTVNATEMDAELCWIAASATSHLHTYPFLKNVHLNGMTVSAQSTDKLDISSAKWLFDPPIPGLGAIEQVSTTRREGRPRESKIDFRTRVAEGLHHRQRGVTAWDIERIVLEKYPQVWKCKCFPCCDGRTGQRKAGSVTLLVIPHAPATGSKACEEKMFDSVTLAEIKRTVESCTNTFSQITIRNPSFDRLQVRASVYFEAGASEGSLVRKLSLALSEQLSVWTAGKPMNRLGWSLNIDELTAFAETLPYVRAIASLEVLHLVHDRSEDLTEDGTPPIDNFLLNDSVATSERTMRHHGLWSLPLSMSQHKITALGDESVHRVQAAGIGDLSIGETLLVQQIPESIK